MLPFYTATIAEQHVDTEVFMAEVIREHLQKIRPSEPQHYRNVSIYPLFLATEAVVNHLVLREALENNLVVIREVDEGGHVPELVVVNNADKPLLILDGEELFGAKQNRVLNTTVLLGKKMTTVIPVSCTEQGRWHYTSSVFKESGIMMSSRLRGLKNQSVRESLQRSGEYRSDQGAIWDGIRDQARLAEATSSTGAMRDVHAKKAADIDEYAPHFPCMPGQQGLLVAVGGRIVGLDLVPYATAYALLHAKLVRSYIMDVILADAHPDGVVSSDGAQSFLSAIADSPAKRYKSVGHGWDLRFESRDMIGSALVYRNRIVHMACFHLDGDVRNNDRMAGFNRRATYRRRNG